MYFSMQFMCVNTSNNLQLSFEILCEAHLLKTRTMSYKKEVFTLIENVQRKYLDKEK
jgi:hypothetical protein